LSVAAENDIPAVYVECSGGGSIDAHELDAYVRGVFAIMVEMGMLPRSFQPEDRVEPQWVYGGGDLDEGAQSKHHGLFVVSTTAGAVVERGDEIGRIYNYDSRLIDTVNASSRGMVMFLRRQARIQAEDVLFMLAQTSEEQG
jgi:predicted deacylase